jgi:hypothetical protein
MVESIKSLELIRKRNIQRMDHKAVCKSSVCEDLCHSPAESVGCSTEYCKKKVSVRSPYPILSNELFCGICRIKRDEYE